MGNLFRVNGKKISYTQFRFYCYKCGKRGRLKSELRMSSRCTRCSSDLIVPVPDVDLSIVKG